MKLIQKQVGDYLVYCQKVRGMAEATIRQKESVLMRFARVTGVASLEGVDNEVFNRWTEYILENGASAQSVNMYNAIVVAMVQYYRSAGMEIPVNLNLIGKMKEVVGVVTDRKFYSAVDVQRVIGAADGVVGLMILIMFETGMRIAELCKLKWSDFEGRRVRFIGKGRKRREVYVTAETFELVREYVGRCEIEGYLWGVYDGGNTLNGEPPTVNTVREWLKKAFREAGFEGFYPHSLRHSFATDLQARGASVEEIKEMIGHSSVATTERYLHGFDGRMKELFDKYR